MHAEAASAAKEAGRISVCRWQADVARQETLRGDVQKKLTAFFGWPRERKKLSGHQYGGERERGRKSNLVFFFDSKSQTDH